MLELRPLNLSWTPLRNNSISSEIGCVALIGAFVALILYKRIKDA